MILPCKNVNVELSRRDCHVEQYFQYMIYLPSRASKDSGAKLEDETSELQRH